MAAIEFFKLTFKPERMQLLERAVKEKGFFSERGLKKASEHLSLNFVVEHCSRHAANEITSGKDSYSHQSQRYVKFTKGSEKFFTPAGIGKSALKKEFEGLMEKLFSCYQFLLEEGIPTEDARFVLPLAFDSNIKVAMHGPKFVEFCIENHNSRYKEVKEIAGRVLERFAESFPATAENLKALSDKNKPQGWEEKRVSAVNEVLLKSDEVLLDYYTSEPEMETALGASLCYRRGSPSEYIEGFTKEKQSGLLLRVNRMGHASIAEHAFFTFEFSVSEATHQQLKRHRLPLLCRESYEGIGAKFEAVVPPSIKAGNNALREFNKAMDAAREFYKKMAGKGIPAEEAIYVLPSAVKLRVVLTSNARDLAHILNRRLCERAQWEVRDLAYKMAGILIRTAPALFAAIGPDCFTVGCREGELSCKRPDIYRNWREKIDKSIKGTGG